MNIHNKLRRAVFGGGECAIHHPSIYHLVYVNHHQSDNSTIIINTITSTITSTIRVRGDHTRWKHTHDASTDVGRGMLLLLLLLAVEQITIVNGSPVTVPIGVGPLGDRRRHKASYHHRGVRLGPTASSTALVHLADAALC